MLKIWPMLLRSLFLILFLLPLGALEESPWMLVEKAKLEIINKEYGNALVLLKKALEQDANFPEAEFLIGEIYMVDGELTLAARQFLKAYNMKEYLDTPAEGIAILYRLGDIYEKQKDWVNWGLNRKSLLMEEKGYYDQVFLHYKAPFIQIYRKEGLDRLLVLYRLNYPFAVKAHSDLGWLYYKSGNYEQALIHLLFALNITCSIVIDELRGLDIRYEYKDMESFLKLALSYKYMNDFLVDEAEIYRLLYYLGAVSRELPEYERNARSLWKVVRDLAPGNLYGKRAARQMISPWREELLDFDSRRLKEWAPETGDQEKEN